MKSATKARWFGRCRWSPDSIAKNQNGNIAVIFAFSLPVLALTTGLAVDFARAYYLKDRLQQTVDSIALASVTALRNGMPESAVQSLAAKLFQDNLGRIAGTASTPKVSLTSANGTFTAAVAVNGVMPATFMKVGGLQVTPVAANAKAAAKAGPIVGGTLNGQGMVWGDPAFKVGSVSSFILCASKTWYNVISDGGFQWNTRCADLSTNYNGMVYTNHKIFIGTHVVTFDAIQTIWATHNKDIFADDTTASPGIWPGSAWVSKITIDGKPVDPRADVAAGIFKKLLLDDAGEGVTIAVQASRHPIPGAFGFVPADNYNFVSIYMTSPHYKLVIAQYDGIAFSDITATNVGMTCPRLFGPGII